MKALVERLHVAAVPLDYGRARRLGHRFGRDGAGGLLLREASAEEPPEAHLPAPKAQARDTERGSG